MTITLGEKEVKPKKSALFAPPCKNHSEFGDIPLSSSLVSFAYCEL